MFIFQHTNVPTSQSHSLPSVYHFTFKIVQNIQELGQEQFLKCSHTSLSFTACTQKKTHEKSRNAVGSYSYSKQATTGGYQAQVYRLDKSTKQKMSWPSKEQLALLKIPLKKNKKKRHVPTNTPHLSRPLKHI